MRKPVLTPNQILGRKLCKAREDAGYTQQRIADLLGVTLWCWNRVENGKRNFDPAWLGKLPPQMRPVALEHLTSRHVLEMAALRESALIKRPTRHARHERQPSA
ncbi:MAG: helix-turn-helix transcriptional regulator [Alphaproteobacteria bacterium]|nr:helix-turn-helix transcriptional regulator [Alphaproteobacteria bacterium]